MSCTIPAPHKVRALRIPADGSDPHLITLETLITEPPTYPESATYEMLLSHLGKEEKARHVPNVIVFWGQRGWEKRNYFWSDYGNEALGIPQGKYYVFMAVDPENLPENKHISNHVLEYYGDAFVLKMVERPRATLADFDHVLEYLHYLRHEHLFPEYEDVDEEIVESDIVANIASDLLNVPVWDAEERAEMADDDADDADDAAAAADDDDHEPIDGVPSGEEVRTAAEMGGEEGHDGTHASPSPRGAGESQEEEQDESSGRNLP